MVRMAGLEPARTKREILSLLCLPIPPHPHNWRLGVFHDTAEAEQVMLHKAFPFLNLTIILYHKLFSLSILFLKKIFGGQSGT